MQLFPTNVTRLNFKDLYDKFFRVPELSIPIHKEILVETIKKGVNDNLWVIKTGERITHSGNIKESIYLNDETELILYEEAERNNLLKPISTTLTPGQQTSTTDSDNLETYMEEKGYEFDIPKQDLKTIAESLPQKIKNVNKNFKLVKKLNIVHHRILPEDITFSKFLMDKLQPDKDCATYIQASLEKYEKSPKYSVNVTISKEDLNTEVGKKTIEIIRQFMEPDAITLMIDLEWKNGISPEEAEKLLLDYDSGNKFVAELKARVSI